MIIVQLRGGLGNQLFQYGFARALADHHKEQLWIDKSFYLPKYGHIRDFELHHYDIYCQKILECNDRFDVDGLRSCYGPLEYANDEDAADLEEVASLGPRVILQGWWSARPGYLFREELKSLLTSELTLKDPIEGHAYARLREQILAASNPVCIQVRRGDYKQLQQVFISPGRTTMRRRWTW